jgi:hypothetical protein
MSQLAFIKLPGIGDEAEMPARPIMEAQVDELRMRFSGYYNIDFTLKPGEFVREKEGLGGIIVLEFKDSSALMLWRNLDHSNPTDLVIIQDSVRRNYMSNVNCIVAVLSSDIRTLVFIPHDTARLERVSYVEGDHPL